MSLIKCPECGKDVSDKVENCIHCGYPIKLNIKPELYCVKCTKDTWIIGKAKVMLSNARATKSYSTNIKDYQKDYRMLASGVTKDRAELLLKYITDRNGEGEIIPDNLSEEENRKMSIFIDVNFNPNAPLMCPRCGSTQVATGQRGFKLTSGFLGSKKTRNRCGKCGYNWEP